ncbi:MAG: hypothetical protein HOC79_05350 [Euryarchaeota archaeon]|nr:hypothetical protein [Euryarchaeota archaeon]
MNEKWIVILTEGSGIRRMSFNDGDLLIKSMAAVIDASRFWDMTRFSQWVRNAKAGQWIEIMDNSSITRALIVRSSDPKGWWVG